MTLEEKLAMWSEKHAFIEGISSVFRTRPVGSCIDRIEYEVYHKTVEGRDYYTEWLIVHYDGGAISPIIVTGNSNTANFKVIANVINSGDYELTGTYRSLLENGWELV